jgi:type I restriction enzyme, S subunit
MVAVKDQKGTKKVPELRFHNFDCGWEEKRIDETMERIADAVTVKGSEIYNEIGIRSHGKGIFHKPSVTGKSLGNKRVYWIKKNMLILNIVFAWEQAVAKTTKCEEGMIASHRFPMYQPLEGKLDLDFIWRIFLTKKGKHLLKLASPGGAGRNKTLGQKTFLELKINLPSFQEQKRITNFLFSIDQWINKLKAQKEKLEAYKKGMMQQIFNQEIRFKDEHGGNSPEWESKKLREVLKIGSGKDYKHLNAGNIPVFGTGGYMLSVDEALHTGESVLIGRKGTIDKPFYYNGSFWTVDTLFYTHSFDGITPKFTSYIFQRVNWKKHNEASGVPSLSKVTIGNIKISYPSLPEQQKIADFLTSLDNLIEAKYTQITKAQTWKDGLMQQLFV